MWAVQTLSPKNGSPVPAPDCVRCHAIGRRSRDRRQAGVPAGKLPRMPLARGTARDELVVLYPLAFSSLDLHDAERPEHYGDGPVEHSHSLTEQIGG